MYSSGAMYLTCPVPGAYQFNLSVVFSTNATGKRGAIVSSSAGGSGTIYGEDMREVVTNTEPNALTISTGDPGAGVPANPLRHSPVVRVEHELCRPVLRLVGRQLGHADCQRCHLLSGTGTHAEPIESPVPNQGDWRWCMMEAAAWVADEAWTDDPANVSPVIAQFCKALNDTSGDTIRQDLVAYLDAAPAGVIDTVDAGKEDDRQLMCTDWLVRTYLPLWFDAAGHRRGRRNRRAARHRHRHRRRGGDHRSDCRVWHGRACCVELCVVRSGLGVAAWRRSR